jgi:hypothetical protein
MSTDAIERHLPGGTSVQDRTAPAASAGRWPPVAVGALSLGLVVAGIALANTTLALQRAWFGHTFWVDSAASLTLVAVGVALLLRGLKAADPAASILGYSGGALLWMGFFEWTWRYFTVWLGIDPLMVDGQPALPGSFLLIQASVCIFLPLTILGVANKDSRCRMMQWFRRVLRLSAPATRGNAHRSDPARVTASETVYVIWFVYLLNISLYDPRLLGASQGMYLGALAVIGLWAVYLVSRHLRIASPGYSVRYAIPTAYLLSILIDGSTLSGLFPAFWIQPLQYPIAASSMVLVFAGCVYGLCRVPQGVSAG